LSIKQLLRLAGVSNSEMAKASASNQQELRQLIGGLLSNLAQHTDNRTLLYKAELQLHTRVSQQLAALTQLDHSRHQAMPRDKTAASSPASLSACMQTNSMTSSDAAKNFEHTHIEIPTLSSLSWEHVQQLQRESENTAEILSTLSATAPPSISKVSRFCHRQTAGRLEDEISDFFASTAGDRPATTSLQNLSIKQRVALPRLSSAPSTSLSLTKTMGTFFCPYQRSTIANLASGSARRNQKSNDAAPFATWSPNIFSTAEEPLDEDSQKSHKNLSVGIEPSHLLRFNKLPHSAGRARELQQKEDGKATSFTLAKFKVGANESIRPFFSVLTRVFTV
jgi:hypothetical protein